MSNHGLGSRGVARRSANIFARIAVRAALCFAPLFLFIPTALVATPAYAFQYKILPAPAVCKPQTDVGKDPEPCLTTWISTDPGLQSCLAGGGRLVAGTEGGVWACWVPSGWADLSFDRVQFNNDQLQDIVACLRRGKSAMLKGDMVTCKPTPTSLAKALGIPKADPPPEDDGGGSGGDGGNALGGDGGVL